MLLLTYLVCSGKNNEPNQLANDTMIVRDAFCREWGTKPVTGAGKSEFIRQLAERSASEGRRALVLCCNRPLSALLREALLADLIVLELGGLSKLDRFGDQIGEYRLRRFTGHYSVDGEQLLTAGDLDIETVGRFKGQQRPHMIVVGLSKDGPVQPRTHRALYVALTRATVGASVVVR